MAITTTTKINSKADALASYHVTDEQLSKCQAIQNASTGKWFYLVESATEAGVEYKVQYNSEHKVLQCLPFNDGPVCKASESGQGCWHKRAALASHSIYRLEQRRARMAEQATVEETEEYQAEQTAQEKSEPHHDGPFCDDSNCTCHDDRENYHALVNRPLLEGLLSVDEANRIFYGRQ